MKKQLAIWTMIVMVLFAPSLSWAEQSEENIIIGIVNDDTVTATSGDSTAIQNQKMIQEQHLYNYNPSSANSTRTSFSGSRSNANNFRKDSGNSSVVINQAGDLPVAVTHVIDLPGNLSCSSLDN